MKSAVVMFPGSNCDRDVFTVMRDQGLNPSMVWHDETVLPEGLDLVVLPGGFSYGDYLRCGAVAARSPIMREVIRFADHGGHVLGICNGFQILTESGLLPGVLMRNDHLQFHCMDTVLRVETNDTAFTSGYRKGQLINLPVAHAEGNYFADSDTLKALNDNQQVVLRYASSEGVVNANTNINGASENIAGIANAKRNVLGLMPHPERHSEAVLGGADGAALFQSLFARLG